MPAITVLYAAIGTKLLQYRVDVERGTLEKFAELELPCAMQYAWANSKRTHLYAACSDGTPPPGPVGSNNCLVALRIDPKTGGLSITGKPAALLGRTVHMTLDATDRYAVVAYNNPVGATVHAIAADGLLDSQAVKMQEMDFGHYPHQIRITPSNKYVVLVTRGTRPSLKEAGTPGALKVASFENGRLKMHASIAPADDMNFGPRHLDFHPAKPWAYVSLELQNKLYMYELKNDQFSSEPQYVGETLPAGTFVGPKQIAGPIHVHPDGKTVYVANRCNGTAEFEGRPFYTGGDNSIAVFSIDQTTGKPTLIQNEETRGMHPRTFSIEPTGRLMVAEHNDAVEVRNASSTGSHIVPGGLSVLRVLPDGRLEFLRRYAVETSKKTPLWWSKMYRIGG